MRTKDFVFKIKNNEQKYLNNISDISTEKNPSNSKIVKTVMIDDIRGKNYTKPSLTTNTNKNILCKNDKNSSFKEDKNIFKNNDNNIYYNKKNMDKKKRIVIIK